MRAQEQDTAAQAFSTDPQIHDRRRKRWTDTPVGHIEQETKTSSAVYAQGHPQCVASGRAQTLACICNFWTLWEGRTQSGPDTRHSAPGALSSTFANKAFPTLAYEAIPLLREKYFLFRTFLFVFFWNALRLSVMENEHTMS